MLKIEWNIQFNTDGRRYKLALLSEVEIVSSVNNLADTATIVLPEYILNKPLNLEGKIRRGSQVIIDLGYNDNLQREFTGYVTDIIVSDGSIKIRCEDALFLFRKPVADKQLKNTDIKQIANYLCAQIGDGYTVNCDYGITYEKFTIRQADAYDVLKKIQQETHANIWFDTENKVLHIHPAYLEKTGEVKYSMQRNVETSSLEYKDKSRRKFEVVIESTGVSGKVTKVSVGTTGGDKFTMKVGAMPKASLQKLAENILNKRKADKYEGSFDTWLIPVCKPGYSAIIEDEDYPDKTGRYYVESVTTKLSASGGVRTITPGIKLG